MCVCVVGLCEWVHVHDVCAVHYTFTLSVYSIICQLFVQSFPSFHFSHFCKLRKEIKSSHFCKLRKETKSIEPHQTAVTMILPNCSTPPPPPQCR